MADLFQGAPLPNVTTTQTQSTVAPDWYNAYLSGLASQTQQATAGGGAAPLSGLQRTAIAGAPAAATAGQPAMSGALSTLTGAAGMPDISAFFNPYTANVVAEINRLGQKQFQETLAPGATAGAVGSGQFGSRRGMQVYGNVARDVNANILGQQTNALSTGWKDAVNQALQEQQNQIAAGGALGVLSGNAAQQGIAGTNMLAGLGAVEQAQRQAELDYPMKAATNAANVMRGFTVPTSTSQTYTGPMPGAYGLSPLQQILGLTGAAGALVAPRLGANGVPIPDSSLISSTLGGLSSLVPEWLRSRMSGGSTAPIDLSANIGDVPLTGDDAGFYAAF